jgi:pilus assembly protein CpaE
MALNAKLAMPLETAQPAAQGRPDVVAFLADAESEAVVRQALGERAQAPGSIHRGDVGKAIEFLTEQRSPGLLIVDVSGVDLPVSQIIRLAEVCEPGVNVIAVGDRSEIGLYRDLLHAGVTDYIAKPLTRELVQKSVQLATGNQDVGRISQKLGKLVTVMGTRGGIGTTTIAVNLAWHLANKFGRRVALVDLDLQTGDCGLMLDLKATPGLREALDNPYRIDNLFLERVMTSHGNRLFVLSAQESLRDELRFTPEAAETLVSGLQTQFHYVVVDMPRLPSAATQRVIDLAALRIIVADETIKSAREIVRLKSVLGDGDTSHTNLLIVNRSGEKSQGFIPASEFKDAVQMQPLLTIPFQAVGRGKPATFELPAAVGRGRMAEAIGQLAAEVSGRHAELKLRRRWW